MGGFEDNMEFAGKFGTTDMRVDSWFDQIADAPGSVHPFSADIPAPKLGGGRA
ncbi:hypothetical protein [Actinoplanes sp. NPDC048796]|uniref:hypothetical protein n=1 Tax=Actinoplanes sp. NPDC048796 TaxID=3155640 RepID=UPI0034102483